MKAEEIILRGKTALVTGGSRGIGESVVSALLEEGMVVWATSRDWEAADRGGEPFKRFDGDFHPMRCDNAHPSRIVKLFKQMRRSCSRLDLLVNNAGLGLFSPCEDVTVDAWDTVMDVNARGTFFFSREAFSWMKEEGGGRIINIASVVGIKGYANQSVYTASKHAVMGITRAMAREGRELGIRVSAVCPGGVDTELVRRARPDLNPSELIRPEDVARAVLYLAKEPETCCTDLLLLRRTASTPFA